MPLLLRVFTNLQYWDVSQKGIMLIEEQEILRAKQTIKVHTLRIGFRKGNMPFSIDCKQSTSNTVGAARTLKLTKGFPGSPFFGRLVDTQMTIPTSLDIRILGT